MKTLLIVMSALLAFSLPQRALAAQGGADAKPKAIRIVRGEIYSLKLLGVPATESKIWNDDYAIGDDGKIRLPMIDRIKIDGLTLPEAQGLIETSLKKHGIFTHPKVLLKRTKKD